MRDLKCDGRTLIRRDVNLELILTLNALYSPHPIVFSCSLNLSPLPPPTNHRGQWLSHDQTLTASFDFHENLSTACSEPHAAICDQPPA